MAARFFLSIPSSISVRDPYEEVFSLFTTETTESLWAHNKSVSQQSTQLELELDFTPVPSPSVSQPGSRPDSRSGYRPTATVFPMAITNDLGLAGSGTMESESGSVELISAGSGSGSGESNTIALNPSISSAPSSPGSILKSKGPTGRLIKSRKSGRNASIGSRKSASTATPQLPCKKPVVIHQSLSTLSQPGQTGTVVWDSSILMSKFMLSIKGLTMGCFRSQLMRRRTQEKSNQRESGSQQEQIRRLEEQAEHLTVSENGELKEKCAGEKTKDHQTASDIDEASYDEEYSSDDCDDEDEDGQGERNSMLVFDPTETSILELGSGCGLLGIVMAEFCQDLLLTDQKPVLPLLIKNLRKNLDKKHFDQDLSAESYPSSSSASVTPQTKKKKKDRTAASIGGILSHAKPCHIQFQELVWGQDLDQDLRRGLGVDYVVATDVVYNESVVPLLVHTLKELCEIRERVRNEYKLRQGKSFSRIQEAISKFSQCTGDTEIQGRNMRSRLRRMLSKTVVLLAQELRTHDVHRTFLEGLQEAGFWIVRIPKQLMDADFQSGYVIYACFLKTKSHTPIMNEAIRSSYGEYTTLVTSKHLNQISTRQVDPVEAINLNHTMLDILPSCDRNCGAPEEGTKEIGEAAGMEDSKSLLDGTKNIYPDTIYLLSHILPTCIPFKSKEYDWTHILACEIRLSMLPLFSSDHCSTHASLRRHTYALINVAFAKGDDGWRLVWIESRLRFIESAENMSHHIPGFRQAHNWFPKEIYFTATLQQVREYREKYYKEKNEADLEITEDWLRGIVDMDDFADEEVDKDTNNATAESDKTEKAENSEDADDNEDGSLKLRASM
ncbi:hypothetical protein BGX27_010471 [Mortierella sp. AM989]|nr:hypothetical protein BGX27_010471 [Mortierella sp. AM989]